MMFDVSVNPKGAVSGADEQAAAMNRRGECALVWRCDAILLALLYGVTWFAVASQASAQDSAAHDDSAVRIGEAFTIGPFATDMQPVPLALTLDLNQAEAAGALEVVELNEADEEIGDVSGVYPSILTGLAGRQDKSKGERKNRSEIRFVPFSDGIADRWEARTPRRFVVRRAQEPAPVDEPLTVRCDGDAVTINNAYYAVTLAHPEGALEGSANDLIRKITFADGPSLRAVRTTSDVVLDGDVYRWRFDSMNGQRAMEVTSHFALLEYGGRFGTPGNNDKVDRLRWHLTLIFYRTLPLIEVSVRIEQIEGTPTRFDLCRFLQVHFDPSGDDAPLNKVQSVDGGRRHSRDLIAARGDAALLGVVTKPYARTAGTIWMRQPPTSAYICSIWESDAVLAETMADTGFYLLLAGDPSLKDEMAKYWSSLALLSDMNERVRIRNLFDAN